MKDHKSHKLKFNPYLEKLYQSDKPLIIYKVDNGQRSEYYDFGRLVRKQGFPEPQGKLKIYFDHYVINSEDSGDVITANSYDASEYDNVPIFDELRLSLIHI